MTCADVRADERRRERPAYLFAFEFDLKVLRGLERHTAAEIQLVHLRLFIPEAVGRDRLFERILALVVLTEDGSA